MRVHWLLRALPATRVRRCREPLRHARTLVVAVLLLRLLWRRVAVDQRQYIE